MRVLIATDGSAPAAIACELGRDLAMRAGGSVRIVGVLPAAAELIGGAWPGVVALDPEPVERAAQTQLEESLGREVERTPADLLPTSVLLRGRPADEIVTEASAWKADLIVVGSRGRGTISSMLLGSVSDEVIDHAPVPVLVARRPRMEHLILAVDPSSASQAALEFLTGNPAFLGMEAHVVGVATDGYPWWLGMGNESTAEIDVAYAMHDEAGKEEKAVVEAASARLVAAGLVSDPRNRAGDPADELCAAAAELDADTIVIGSRGQTGVKRLILGSVTRRVLRHGRWSVLVVHPTARPQPILAPEHGDPVFVSPTSEIKEHAMKILLAYDGGEPAKRALDTAASIAKVMGAGIDVISVVPVHPGRSPVDPWDDREAHDVELTDARTRLAELGVPCRILEPAGNPAEQIELAAKNGGYDMIVLGSRRQGALGRMLQGSVSEHVATHADTTVVIAR